MEPNTPNLNDKALFDVIRAGSERMEQTALNPDDEQSLCAMVKAIRAGTRAVMMVEQPGGRLQYMFTDATRTEAVQMMCKVIDTLVNKD